MTSQGLITPQELDELIAYLTPQEIAELDKLLATTSENAIDWTPNAGPQTQALESKADVLGFGGRAGGGKSNLLIGVAVTQHKRATIFRREANEVRDLLEKLREVVGNEGIRESPSITWRNRKAGKFLQLAGLQNARDWRKWRGIENDFLGFDEADQFVESQVRAVMGWVRSSDPNQRKRVILTFNPPESQEGMWIIDFFGPWLKEDHPYKAAPGELRWFTTIDGKEVCAYDGKLLDGTPFTHKGELIKPRSRTFIPATLADNPYLAGTDYQSNLQALPEPLRSQLLNGDFLASMKDGAWQTIPTAYVKAAQVRWTPEPPEGSKFVRLAVDVARGGRDSTVIGTCYETPDGGEWYGMPQKYPGRDTPDGKEVADLAETYLIGLGLDPYKSDINIDSVGVGASPLDEMVRRGMLAVGINNGAGSSIMDITNSFGFANKRAEILWGLRQKLDPRSKKLVYLPPHPDVLSDLCSSNFSIQSKVLKIESKDDIKERLLRSPDVGDMIAMASYKQVSTFDAVMGFMDRQLARAKERKG